jgi:Na+/H+-dicarboxylate symporter
MKNHLFIKVFIALLCALFAGWYTGAEKQVFGVPFLEIYNLIGQLFLNALTLVVVPLVVSSIITGAARIGAEHSFGRLGARTFKYYVGTSALAVLVGLVCILLFTSEKQTALAELIPAGSTAIEAVKEQSSAFQKVQMILLKIVPPNIFAAAAQGQMMGLIFFSLLFGFFSAKLESGLAAILMGFWKGIFQTMMRITECIMRFLPFGVFGLMAKVVATTGLESLSAVAFFFALVLGALLFYSLIILPLLLGTIAKVNPITHFRAVAPALFTAFSTSSSAAALPIAMECIEKRAGVSNRICSFTIPLGNSFNMSGTALYQCVAALFIARVYGVEFSVFHVGITAFLALFTSFGTAGIPSASLISVVIILNTLGIPAEGIGLILAVERLLDMCRTTVNVLGNTCCSVLVARSEGEQVLDKKLLVPRDA